MPSTQSKITRYMKKKKKNLPRIKRKSKEPTEIGS